MSGLVDRLAQDGITDVDQHWSCFSVETLSGLFHRNVNYQPLAQAAAAWEQLGDEFDKLNDQWSQSVSVLEEAWSGLGMQGMVDAFGQYAKWMRATADVARKTADGIREMDALHRYVRAFIVPPEKEKLNSDMAKECLASQGVGDAERLTELAAERRRWRCQHADAMTQYCSDLMGVEAALPQWPDVDDFLCVKPNRFWAAAHAAWNWVAGCSVS